MTANGQLDVVVVGAGFNGLYQLHRLRAEGFAVELVEAAPELGGVWYWNSYPGARVDSHVPNYEFSLPEIWRDWYWTERFPGRDELVAYFRHVGDVLDLHRDIRLSTRVERARFDDVTHRWTLTTDGGDDLVCRSLVLCTGFATAPYVPDIPGLDRARWHHTGRWPEAGVDLDGKKVAVIGTGASAVQVVQEASKVVDHLTVFQRTPVTALAMQQRRLTVEGQDEAKRSYPELFRRRNEPPGSLHDIERLDVSALAVSDAERRRVYEEAWAKGGFHYWVGTFNDIGIDEAANRTAYDFWCEQVRARITDAELADILAPLEPPYPFGTKRPSLEQDYYDVVNQDNVTVVDVRADPITGIGAAGVDTDAGHHEADVIVMATGFDANTGGLTAIDITDTRGVSLRTRWADGVDTHLGVAVSGLPNLLFLYGPQSPTAFCNGPTCAELQGEWVVEFLVRMREEGRTRFEATPDAEAAWTAQLDLVAEMSLLGKTDSWYMSANVPGKRRQLLNYPLSDDYLERLRAEADADLPGFVLT